MKALVTGGGGFLGSAIVRSLLGSGYDVKTFQRGDYPFLYELGVEVRRGDLADGAAVLNATEDCDVLFHVAAKDPYSWAIHMITSDLKQVSIGERETERERERQERQVVVKLYSFFFLSIGCPLLLFHCYGLIGISCRGLGRFDLVCGGCGGLSLGRGTRRFRGCRRLLGGWGSLSAAGF